jgi:uncharacterized protein involved in exopolysaccharide biosynthesis
VLELVRTPPRPAAEFSLFDLAGILVRRRLVVATVFLIVLGATAAATLAMTPIYESTAILMVKLGREFKNTTENGGGTLVTPSQVINTEMVILRSNEVIEAVVASLGPELLYPGLLEAQEAVTAEAADPAAPVRTPLALASRRFAADLSVEGITDTQVIRVSFRHPDPQIAADAVNLLIDRFQERHLWAFGEAQATAFLEDKVATYRAKLDEVNDSVRTFLEQHPGFAIEDIGDVVGRERRDLAAQAEAARREIAAGERELAELKQELAGTSRYQAGDLREQLEQRILEVKAKLKGLGARQSALQQQMTKYDAELAELPRLRKEYDSLVRERASAERLYQSYSVQLEDARVSEEMDRQKIANIAVLQAGMAPTSPVHPRKALNLAIGAVAAAGLGMLGALVVEAGQSGRGR